MVIIGVHRQRGVNGDLDVMGYWKSYSCVRLRLGGMDTMYEQYIILNFLSWNW